jgi:hypothetical protein
MDALEFKYRMGQLSRPTTEKFAPYWEYWRMVLYDWAMENDPADFCKCPAVYHCMLVEHWTQSILYEFSIVRDFLPVLSIEFSKAEYNNLIHQAYHLYQWQQVTGKQIKDLNTIVEFGGGYGAMCLLCHRLGFKGRYVIYDLPEFSLLQEWYLSQHKLSAEWNPKRKPKDVDLFMALYSLSEVEPGLRDSLLIRAKSYLYLYSGQWEAWDNVEWFMQFAMTTSLEWQHTELGHLPDHWNFYSFGW